MANEPQQQQAAEGQQNAQPAAAPENGAENGKDLTPAPALEFTEEQMERKVKCRTAENEIVEAPWHLMAQSRTFHKMWVDLGMEETFNQPDKEEFVFPLNEITKECFDRLLVWMGEHHGLPEPVVKEDPITTERIWFEFTEFERTFFDVDFETVKEYFLAANFLDLRSLYYYCAQECARCIMDKEPEQIREMLCLEDDLTDEAKQQIRAEFGIPDPNADEPQPGPSGVQQGNAEAGRTGSSDAK